MKHILLTTLLLPTLGFAAQPASQRGQSLIEIIKKPTPEEENDEVRHYQRIKGAIDAGANVEEVNADGWTVLHAAAEIKNNLALANLVKLLPASFIDCLAQYGMSSKLTALHILYKVRRPSEISGKIITMGALALLNAGADPNVIGEGHYFGLLRWGFKNPNGGWNVTPLQLAVESHATKGEILPLIEAGADARTQQLVFPRWDLGKPAPALVELHEKLAGDDNQDILRDLFDAGLARYAQRKDNLDYQLEVLQKNLVPVDGAFKELAKIVHQFVGMRITEQAPPTRLTHAGNETNAVS